MEYQKLNTLTLSEQAKREIHKYIKNMDLSRNNKLPREEVTAASPYDRHSMTWPQRALSFAAREKALL